MYLCQPKFTHDITCCHLLIRMGCISTTFLFYQSFVCVCRHECHRLSLSLSLSFFFSLYIYTHEKRSPTYTHKEREQMIDNLTEKRCASRTISRCGLKAIMRNMNQIPNLLARDVKYKQLPFFNNNYFY